MAKKQNDLDILIRAIKRALRGIGAILLSTLISYLITFLQTDPEIKELSFYAVIIALIPILQGVSKYIRDKYGKDFQII